MSRNLLIAALALGSAAASAQVLNTQVNGLTLTNGLSSITDSSGLGTYGNVGTGVGYLTDNDISTIVYNVGVNLPSSSLEGNFGGAISPSATGVYIVSLAQYSGGTNYQVPFGPSVSVQLLLTSGLSNARSYGETDFVINTTQENELLSFYEVTNGSSDLAYPTRYISYMPISFSDFSVSPEQVLGIRLSNFTDAFPDISFIGVGYTGAPIPEPSTYGLILGGLALAGAAIRRRKSAK
jgi:hypothetical protein